MAIIPTGSANDVPSGATLGSPNAGWQEIDIREWCEWLSAVIALLIIGSSLRWPRMFTSTKAATTGVLACTFVGFYIVADSTVSALTHLT